MNAEILSIGTELVLGDIVNTNAQYLSKQLALKGINVFYQSNIGDNPERIIRALSIAMARSILSFSQADSVLRQMILLFQPWQKHSIFRLRKTKKRMSILKDISKE